MKTKKNPTDWVAIKSRTDEEARTKNPIKANIAVSISGRTTSSCLFQPNKLKLACS